MPESPNPSMLEQPAPRLMRPWKWIGLAIGFLGWVLSSWLPVGVSLGSFLCLVIVAFNLIFHLLRRLRNYLFWSVRNRVIGSFVFVGLIPLLLLFGVIYLSLRMLLGQIASNYFEAGLRDFGRELSAINEELGQQIPVEWTPEKLDALAARTVASHAEKYPSLAARLVRKRADGSFEDVWISDPKGFIPRFEKYPAEKWLGSKTSFDGLLGARQAMILSSLRTIRQIPAHYLEISAPIDAHFERRLQKEKEIYTAFLSTAAESVTIGYPQIKLSGEEEGAPKDEQEVEAMIQGRIEALEAQRKNDARRMVSWVVLADSWSLATGKDLAAVAMVHVPLRILTNHYFAVDSAFGQVLLNLITILLGLFVAAELVSVFVGATISRRITRSIHEMYQGTLALQRGDLDHRIPVRRSDQLGLLAHSFNQMTGSIARLLEEVSEKKRLEQELEIAREVQATLFPRQLPNPRGMSIFGGCEPARVVSGDYYDFVVQDEARLCIVVADISGKGISAALLMANLQAAMRNQLASVGYGIDEETGQRLSALMSELNQQIYENSPSEKYATLFLGRFDAGSRKLHFCNAGHLPPVVLAGEEIRRLEAGGVAVGLFPNMSYGSSSIEMEPGTVLALFTDGVTEAVNGAEEEFGEDRLIAALQEARSRTPEAIYRHIVDRVREWQGSLPQHDDITLIVAKVN